MQPTGSEVGGGRRQGVPQRRDATLMAALDEIWGRRYVFVAGGGSALLVGQEDAERRRRGLVGSTAHRQAA